MKRTGYSEDRIERMLYMRRLPDATRAMLKAIERHARKRSSEGTLISASIMQAIERAA